LVLRGKGFFLSFYLLLTLNFIACLLIGFTLISYRLGYWPRDEKDIETPEATIGVLIDELPLSRDDKDQETLEVTTSFLFYDLPLPRWAQGFIMPIAGARIPNNRNLLPGAPRAYRNGKHQGVDLFSDFDTPVQAAKFGYVILAGKNYVDAPRNYRKRLLELSKRIYQTPPEILEVLHGQRVIVDHGVINGRWVVTSYSHLSRIKEGLKVGDHVNQGDVIGYVGNSGTSKAGTRQGAHLHFEIRVNGHYLGEGMSVQEAGQLLESMLERN